MFFILSQISGGIALTLSFVSYFLSQKKNFLVFQIILNVFYALSFIFANSLIAGLESLIYIIFTIIFFFYEKYEKRMPIFYLIIFSAIYIIIGIIYFNHYFDIIPIITSILFTAVIWFKEMQMIRYFLLIANSLLIFYEIISQVYTTAILDFLDTLCLIISIIIWHLKNKRLKNRDLL